MQPMKTLIFQRSVNLRLNFIYRTGSWSCSHFGTKWESNRQSAYKRYHFIFTSAAIFFLHPSGPARV